VAANAVNLLAKSTYAYMQGSRAFAFQFFVAMCIMIISSLTTYILFL
jgi:hypothetical protein